MASNSFRKPWFALAAVVLAAAAAPALSQYKPGHGVDVTVYASPT